jgi:hypothetical protein
VKRRLVVFTIAAMLGTMLASAATARAATTVDWVGNGLDSVHICQRGLERPHLHWVLTPGDTPVPGTTAELFINGKDAGTMVANGPQGALQLTISVSTKFSFEDLEDATVHAEILTGSVGEGAVLNISDGCLCTYD